MSRKWKITIQLFYKETNFFFLIKTWNFLSLFSFFYGFEVNLLTWNVLVVNFSDFIFYHQFVKFGKRSSGKYFRFSTVDFSREIPKTFKLDITYKYEYLTTFEYVPKPNIINDENFSRPKRNYELDNFYENDHETLPEQSNEQLSTWFDWFIRSINTFFFCVRSIELYNIQQWNTRFYSVVPESCPTDRLFLFSKTKNRNNAGRYYSYCHNCNFEKTQK